MSDNLGLRGTPDNKRINLGESWEVRSWCTKLNLNEKQLRYAVAQAGTSAAAVEQFVKSNRLAILLYA